MEQPPVETRCDSHNLRVFLKPQSDGYPYSIMKLGMTDEQVQVSLKPVSRAQKSYRILVGVVGLLAVGLMIYAQTEAFVWDEGWHLLAAQSITRGKRLYLDFNYSQTPLNAYWNAFWFTLLGTTWRTAHAIAALMTSGAIMLTADYVFVRFPVARWRRCRVDHDGAFDRPECIDRAIRSARAGLRAGPVPRRSGIPGDRSCGGTKNDRPSRACRISLFGGRRGHSA